MPEFHQRWLIPRQFQRGAGVLALDFRILDAYSQPARFLRVSDDRAVEIPPAAVCVLHLAVPKTYLVDLQEHARLAEAIMLFGKAFHTGNRIQRYMTVYRAYECVVEDRAVELSAVRHSLSHPPKMLTNPRIRSALLRLFGGLHINLDLYQHRKTFFSQLGRLVRDTDVAIAEAILEAAPDLEIIRSAKEILRPDQIGPRIEGEDESSAV